MNKQKLIIAISEKTEITRGLLAYRVVNTVRYQLKRKLNEADTQPENTDSKTDITPVNLLNENL